MVMPASGAKSWWAPVAHALRSPSLLGSVRAAFVHGTDVALLVSVGFACAGLVLSLAFLPSRAQRSVAAGAGLPGVGRIAA